MRLRSRRHFISVLLYSVLLCTLVVFMEFASAKQAGTETAVWNVTVAPNTRANSAITIRNRCKGTHSFTVTPRDVPYFQLTGDPTTSVPGRSDKKVPVTFNSTGMRPGEYQGSVAVSCENCGEERGCSQENEVVPIHFTISPGIALPIATPTPIQEGGDEHNLSCNNEKCRVREIILNTGYDQIAGTTYSPVQPDGYWEVVDAPNPGLTLPTPAWSINSISAWQTLPNSTWISPYMQAAWSLNNPTPAKPYSLQRCFCTCDGIKSLRIDLEMLVDNIADVYFDGVLIGQQTDTGTGSFNKSLTIHKEIAVKPGKHCLRIDMRNLSAQAMGVDVVGTISSPTPTGAALFLSAACCNPTGKIMGQKIEDKECDGKTQGEPGLQGWTITATNTSTGASVSAVTDANGFYYFNNLPAGTYTISEGSQSGWTQSIPGGAGTYTVTLAAGQVIQKDFANCKKGETTECATVVAREPVCKTDGSGGYTYTFTVTNTSGHDVSQILLTPAVGSLSFSEHTFNIPLHNGQSTTITVDIGNVKPDTENCFYLTLMTKDGPCCTIRVCPVFPDCCATGTGKFECDPKGEYRGTFTIVNTSPNVIKNIYLYPPAGVTMSQTYFAVTLAPGQSFTTPVIIIKGAKPGRFCFRFSMHTADMKDCCSVEVCIVLPECHIGSANFAANPAQASDWRQTPRRRRTL